MSGSKGHFKYWCYAVLCLSSIHFTYGQVALPGATVGVPNPTSAGGTGINQGHSTVGVGVPLSPVIVPLGGGTISPAAPYIPIQNNAPGPKAISDPSSDPGVQRLLQHPQVLQWIQINSKADSAVKISNLITALKQVVSGQVTYLSLHVIETVCPVGTIDLLPCQQDVTEDSYVCELAVWQRPWLNSTKIIQEKSRCEEREDDNDFKSVGHLFSTYPPLSSFARPLQSLPREMDSKQIAVEAFNYIDKGSKSDFVGKMVNYDVGPIMFDPAQNVTSVRMNIEYGFTLCLKPHKTTSLIRSCPADNSRPNYVCSVTVVHNPNDVMRLQVIPDNDDDIQCSKKNFVNEELVVAVPAPCPNCPQPAPLSDPTVLAIAKYAVTEYDRISDDDDLHMMVKLIKANTQSQATSGIKYFLTVEAAETNCHKIDVGVDVDRSLCQLDHTEEPKVCELQVIDQAWIPARELVYGRCYDKNSYPPRNHGDEFIVPVISSPVQGIGKSIQLDQAGRDTVNYIIADYNRREVDDFDDAYYKLVKVHESSSRPAANGQERHFVIELGETNCFFSQPHPRYDLSNCTLNLWEEHEVCEVRVLEQNTPTGLQRAIQFIDCDDLDDYLFKKTAKSIQSFSRQHRPFIPQGRSAALGTKVPTTNPTVTKAAAFVVQQYNLQSDDDEIYVLSNIHAAYTQQANSYTLELELAETSCKKYQPVVDPTRCPIDYSEEPEMCQAEVSMSPTGTHTLGRLYCDDREDYYIHKLAAKVGTSIPTHSSGLNGPSLAQALNWPAIDVNSRKLVRLGEFVVNEFDLRSDEDNVFVLNKLHTAKQQVDGGLNFYLTLEIAETVCPKYKQGINKTRCAIDIGEEHKMCEAIVQEQEWLNKRQVIELQCADLDDFYSGDDSREILYPNVHPTAHARPIFLSQFKKSFSRKHSVESDESNEKYYRKPGQNTRPTLAFDSDEGHDSDESRHWFRGRRSIPGGHTEVSPSDAQVKELANFGLASMDELNTDPRARRVTEVLKASKQVVSGLSWKIQVKVLWTTCLKEDQPEDLESCPADSNDPEYICDMVIWEQAWLNSKKVTESNCTPVSAVKA